MKRTNYILFFVFLFLPLLSRTQEQEPLALERNPYVEQLSDIPAKDVGIYIEDLRNGEVVLDVNGEKFFTPASVTKLVTASTLMNREKLKSRFTTQVDAQGKISNGVLDGNILINVCGDPTIESSHFPENSGFAKKAADAIKAVGIDTIRGSVAVTYRYPIDQAPPAGWVDEDFIQPYGAELHAANYADNLIYISMPSGKSVPETPGITIARTGRNRRVRGTKIVELTGSRTVANPDPESTLCMSLVNALGKIGIDVEGRSVPESNKVKKLYVHQSPSYYDILKSLMYRSDNLMAEGMLRAAYPGLSREGATNEEIKLWGDKGIDTKNIVIEDGSGLSRRNKISPYFLAEVLDWMRLHKNHNNQYVEIFPAAGVSGTMRNFLKGTPLQGRLRMKTGSMRNVQCYAGFMTDNDAKPTHLVVIMINNFNDRGALKKALSNLLIKNLL